MSLRNRLEALEQAFNQADGAHQLGLLLDALQGDQRAFREFAALREHGRLRGRLDEVYDACPPEVRLEIQLRNATSWESA